MIDYAEITVSSGKGGDGLSHFMRVKYNAWAGPDGGDGGKGGDVIIVGSEKIKTLSHFRQKKFYKALPGQDGIGNFKSGKNSLDLELYVPLGTVITDIDSNKFIADVSHDGQRILLLQGGTGGRGNASFKSSTNQAPEKRTLGVPSKTLNLKLELKLLSDVGFIGLPSVGKSSLLNYMTGSRSKTAEYHFTTLEPSIGILKFPDLKTLVLADLPGLIEGASEGKGLGDDFLRHIERCGLLVHVLDPSQTKSYLDKLGIRAIFTDLLVNYDLVRLELSKWDKKILTKNELVLLNKSDLFSEEDSTDLLHYFEQHFNQKYIKISDWFYISDKAFINLSTPVGLAFSSTYSGEGINELINFFNENFSKIIKVSKAQISQQGDQDKVLEIDVKNIPNKRIHFKYDK